MCDYPKAFQSIQRKARKDHICVECKETINKGEKYQYSSGVWDEPASYKQCLRCYKISNIVVSDCDGEECLGFGELIDWFYGHVCQGFNIDQVVSFYTEKWKLGANDLDFINIGE